MSELKAVCSNPWCKATFFYRKEDMILLNDDKKSIKSENEEKIPPKVCQKCKSFDTELSGGIEWKDKKYEGDRWDNQPHQIKYKITNYRL